MRQVHNRVRVRLRKMNPAMLIHARLEFASSDLTSRYLPQTRLMLPVPPVGLTRLNGGRCAPLFTAWAVC